MAFDKLYIINEMMIEIGEDVLTSLGKDSKAQRLANQSYEGTVEEVFAMRIDYKFATARAELTALDDSPNSGYDYQFKLPDGHIRTLAMVDENGDEIQYKHRHEVYINGSDQEDVILTNQSECRIKFIVLRTNPARWKPWFRRLVILHGANKLCKPVSTDEYKALRISKRFDQAFIDAKGANNAEDADVDENSRNIKHGNNDVVEAVTGPQPKETDYRGWDT